MSDKEIYQALKAFCDKIEYMVENEKEISIISHLDADGIASGSIISSALARLGAKCAIRTVSDMTLNVLEQMRYENHDFYIITDLGGGMANEFNQALDNRWAIIDHHQIPEHEISIDDNNQILNAWKYGIDGGKEISAGGMAYMVATTLDRKNKNLSPIAIVSALADRQDQGEKKSLFGLNSEIVKTAQSLRLISMDLDLMFTGRETRPIHEALAYTAFPYIEGLTWATESCYAVIKNAGIKMSNNGRWRVLSEISQDEKNIILNAIADYVVNSSKNKEVNIIDNLIGYTYTLINEDQRSLLRDAREFSTMLNACGRIRKAGVGIGICMGDRNDLLNEGEKIVTKYRTTLRNYISSIFVEKWRMIDNGKSIFINGEGLLAEDMLGAISSLLSGSPTLGGRLVFVRTLTNDGFYKFSSRKSLGSTSKSDLGLIMRYCSESVGGSGGGHSSAAGCRIPSVRLEEFLSAVRNAILDAKFTAAS
ncbi:MAG TPA: DHH family phosphoesterase [Nitrososphaeraceae archaeon]|jgi:RecJ-like exonuclease|nr:DHH family phosphoesterase [Nitrososphaeraceae archaeon]